MSSRQIKRLIDIGANLTDPMFRGVYHSSQRHEDDFKQMLERAKASNIDKIIVTGGSLEDSKRALDIAELGDQLYSTVGCHPTRCNEFNKYTDGPEAYLAALSKLAHEGKPKVVAIGEIGLDYDRLHFCDKETQKKYFEMQLSLAENLKLPLFLHNRNSIDDFAAILERNRDKFMSRGGVVHSFDGSHEDLRRLLDLGLYIGINGCSLKTEANLDVAKSVPKERLLIETDCPWCEIKQTHASMSHIKTRPKRSKDAKDSLLPVKGRNEPSLLIQILEVLASLRQDDIDDLADTIYVNTNKLFFQ